MLATRIQAGRVEFAPTEVTPKPSVPALPRKLIRFVPPRMFHVPLIVYVVFEASTTLAAIEFAPDVALEVVNVPPFINTGDVIRVSTDTGEYLARA